jgi:hypothetical protein
LNQNGDYEGSFNNIDYVIVYENGTWKVKQDETVVASNSSLIGAYNDEFTDSGYNESFVVSEGVCSETSPLFLQSLCMSIDRIRVSSPVLKINLIWTPNENAYIGYEQVEGFTLRKYSIRLTNGVWTIFTEDSSTPLPQFTGGTSETSISEMSELLPVPISSSWTEYYQPMTGGYYLINTSSSC